MAYGVAAWQLDVMRQDEDSRIWEQMHNVPDYSPVISKLWEAVNSISTAQSRIGTAAELVNGTPMDDRIMSFMIPLDDISNGIKELMMMMQKEMGR